MYNDAQRLAILTEYLSEQVRKGISIYLGNPIMYRQALMALEMRRGHPFLIVQSHSASLQKLPFIKDNNTASLQDFALELSSADRSLVAAGYEHELTSTDLLSGHATKLQPKQRESWGDKVYQLQPRPPTVIDFEGWIDQRATTAIFNASLNEARVEWMKTER